MTHHIAQAELLVCVKCRRGREIPVDDRRPGGLLYDSLRANAAEGIRVRPVECLQNCEAGCTVALRASGKWTYVYGGFDETDPAHHQMIFDTAQLYAATTDGVILWRDRPEHIKKNCVARVPALDMPLAGEDDA